MNIKVGLLLAGAALILAACGDDGMQTSEEQNDVAEETEAVEQEKSTEQAASEEAETEETEESSEAQKEGEAPEAISGKASELLSKGEKTSFVFKQIGEFSIFCEPHPVMKMTVVVEEGDELSGEVELDIADYEFSEETIVVAPGTIITWTNLDGAQHNVAFK
ncbi:plastocyanin/azurin family copper-binding protein [Planomicrobium sp. Y74]|uniref:plastocyanin/azurin family copper-binding protein n=1 Tax=Planomicrobium sp. Y74 TaxID=2478977 RepID=UPI000EF5493F|nr:plastocyanin/azurin family copper-binding protein [Planomicrobium sp. Y74]RLQ81232.1 hypothetical protein D9754_18315 [Planomicrobium sp. Y74]